MARCPFAVWHRVPGSEPAIRPTQFIFHTAVVRDLDSLVAYFSGPSGGIESHFAVGGKWGSSLTEDGKLVQMRDTEEQADANLDANARAISVETCDNAPANPSDIQPWTPKQVDTLVRLGRWAAETHGIPKRICPAWDQPGFGWHAMWGAPSHWTPSAGKVCPGPVRIAQLKSEVLPRIFAGTDPLPPPPPDQWEEIMALFADKAEFQTTVQAAVEDALERRGASPHLFVSANDARGVFVVTTEGLVHVDGPAQYAALSGGKPLGTAPTGPIALVDPDWLTSRLALEG